MARALPVPPAAAGTRAGPTPGTGTAAKGRWPLRRARDWWLTRHPNTDTWTLNQRNIYILPTKGGLVFALTLLVMLLSSINYQLNLGYVLTFLLAGSALVSIHLTHGSLRGLTLRLRPSSPVFAGDAAQVEVVIANAAGARHGLSVHFRDLSRSRHTAWCDVPALGQASAQLRLVPATRGWHPVPAVVVETRFPFGLFRAWTLWRPAGQVLAYPRPEPSPPPLPLAHAVPGETRHARQGQGSELDGVRAWRRGDSLRQVVWKKVARTGQLISRENTTDSSRDVWIDWQAAAAAGDAESRLSRIAAWVLLAELQGLSYGLRLPGRQLPPDRGDAHQRQALLQLALWS